MSQTSELAYAKPDSGGARKNRNGQLHAVSEFLFAAGGGEALRLVVARGARRATQAENRHRADRDQAETASTLRRTSIDVRGDRVPRPEVTAAQARATLVKNTIPSERGRDRAILPDGQSRPPNR
ncbi:MAG: hypothetical protein QOF91_2817 [Alphaproteobacteria bacterium]|nr:hypothetical protein [Alphaproteobacteria bacterium]